MDQHIAMRICNVGVRYRLKTGFFSSSNYWALRNISFEVRKGETLGVVGRNGVGKTSLLQVMAGIINPDCGSVESFGNSVSLLGLFVGLHHKLSGRHNAVMNAMLQGVSQKAIEAKLSYIQEFTELGEFFDQPARTYSAGMRARLRFAVSIQTNPDILLIDEVLGIGDATFRQKSTEIVKERILSDKTVLIVSHHMDTLRDLCDRVVWLEGSETKMIGSTEEVLACYEQAGAEKKG